MKKAITFIVIIALSLGIGFSWTKMEDFLTKKFHPIKYYEYVEMYSEQYGVPKEIILAVIKCESSFVADAVSPKGAVGLMQIMPSTYEWLCTKTGDEPIVSTLYDPAVNIKYGTYYLGYLYGRFGVWETTYAAYNAGDARVKGWLEDSRYGLDGRLVDIPFPETANYVEKVSDNARTYAQILNNYDYDKVDFVPVVE